MRLTSQRDELASALAVAARAASGKSTLPILSHLLLSADADGVVISATDMELSLRVPLEASVEAPGSIVLPRLAADVVRSLPAGTVVVEHRENEASVHVQAGSASFRLNCLQAGDFPQLPSADGDATVLPTDRFIASVDRVARAASRDDTRPVLTGVLIRVEPGVLTLVATDSYRLALRVAPIDESAVAREALVPARVLREVARLAAGRTDGVEMIISDQLAAFRVGGIEVMSRLIDGQFPDYRQLIPEQSEHEVRFDREELLAVLGRIGVLAPRGTPLRLAFARGEVTVMALSEQHGEGRETLPVAYEGEPLEIRFNAEFLRDGAEATEGDEVRLGLISPLRPGIVRGAGDDFTYLLMPIRQG